MLRSKFYTRLVICQILIGSIFGGTSIYAQNNRFGVGVTGGVNLSQINGDRHKGYDKVGLFLGLNGIVNLKKNFNVGLELGYSQRGSKSGKIDLDRIEFGIHPFNLQLNYAEITLAPNFFFYETYDDYFRFRFTMGVSFARLINAFVEETIFTAYTREEPIIYSDLLDEISNNDLNGIFGLTFFFNERTGLELRYGLGLKPIYQEKNREFLAYYLSLRGNYNF